MRTAPRWELELTRYSSAQAARVIARSLISPRVYASVGLDPSYAAELARTSPHRREVMRQAASRLVEFLADIGLLTSPARRLWRGSGLVG
jgi:hypothetical protein